MTRRAHLAWGIVGIVVVLSAMQLAVGTGLVSEQSVPTASAMLVGVAKLAVSSGFLAALTDTLWSTMIAFVAAGLAGTVLGVVLGASDRLYRSVSGLIDMLRPIPSVALLPVAILLFGIGLEMKVLLATYAAFWPVLINTIYGVRDVDRVMVATARGFAWGRMRVMRQVMLPAALPFVATGLRVASAVALVVVLTAELLAAEHGVGTVIRAYQVAGRADFVYAGVVVVAVVGLVLNVIVSLGERRLVHWAPQNRG